MGLPAAMVEVEQVPARSFVIRAKGSGTHAIGARFGTILR